MSNTEYQAVPRGQDLKILENHAAS